MTTKSDDTMSALSCTTLMDEESLLQQMNLIKDGMYAARRKNKDLKLSEITLKKRMRIFAEFLNHYNECYRQGVIDAVQPHSISTLGDFWFKTVKAALKNEKDDVCTTNYIFPCPKQEGMSDNAYSFYMYGFVRTLSQYNLSMDQLLKRINI